MSVNIKSLVLEAVEAALKVAQRQIEKRRPIENLYTDHIARQFLEEKMTSMADTDTRNLYLVTAIIESEDDLDETLELEEVWKGLKDGYVTGFNGNESGRYAFGVYTLKRS